MTELSKLIHYLGDSIAKLTVGFLGLYVVNILANDVIFNAIKDLSVHFKGQEPLFFACAAFLVAYPLGLFVEAIALLVEKGVLLFLFSRRGALLADKYLPLYTLPFLLPSQTITKVSSNKNILIRLDEFYEKFDLLQKGKPEVAFTAHKIKFEGKIMYSMVILTTVLSISQAQKNYLLFTIPIAMFFLASRKTKNFVKRAINLLSAP